MEQLKSLVKSRARLKSNIKRVLAWAEQTEIATHTEIVTRIDLPRQVEAPKTSAPAEARETSGRSFFL